MAKYHFLTGDDLLAIDLTDRVARCVEIKAEVVAADEREGGRRALLNYGHTLAHALEIATEHRPGARRGGGDRADLRRPPRQRCSVASRSSGSTSTSPWWARSTGSATDIPAGLDPNDLLDLMRRDKKALDGLTFVLDGPRGVEVVAGVDDAPVLAALGRMMSVRASGVHMSTLD